MRHPFAVTSTALLLLCTGTSGASAQDSAPVYGSQLMTRQERIEYRNQVRALKTEKERNAFRLEHHEKMQEWGRERGLSQSDTPPSNGVAFGSGRGGGMEPGMGGDRSRP